MSATTHRPVKFHKVPPAQEADEQQQPPLPIPTCFDEIETPTLIGEEKNWTGTDRDIIICLKKCEAYQAYPGGLDAYKWIKPVDIVNWLQRPEQTMIFGTQPEGLLADMTCVIGPANFHLVWKNSDYYLSKLLRRWMHVMIKGNDSRFPSFDDEEIPKVGQYCAVFYLRDGRWYRGVILQKMNHASTLFSVQLIDDGTKLTIAIDRMRKLPVELQPPKCRPLAFQCQLAEMENYNECVLEKLIHTFIRNVRCIPLYKVAVHKIDMGSRIRFVSLWDVEDTDNYINKKVVEVANKYALKTTQEFYLNGKEIAKDVTMMVHMNAEVKVRDFHDIKLKGLRNWRVTNVVSPYEFYLEYVYDSDTRENQHWLKKMQEFYNDENLRERYRVLSARIYRRRHYVWWNELMKNWERVRVLNSDATTLTATVYLVDHGTREVAGYQNLWEMNPAFSTFSAKAFPTYLVDVAPRDGGQVWSQESIDAFKHMVLGDDKIFHGVIVHRNIYHNEVGGLGEERLHLGVVLIEKNRQVAFTVQAALVVFEFAQSTGLSSARNDIFEHEGFGLGANFSFEDFKEYRRKNPLTGGSECKDQKLRARILGSERLEIIRQNAINTPDALALPPADLLNAYKPYDVSAQDRKEWEIPEEVQAKLPQMKLVHIIHPGCMYVQRASKQEEINQMMAAIGERVETLEPVTENNIKIGDFVAVFHQLRFSDDPSWFRACVRQVMGPLELAKIILVDYGSEVLSKFSILRMLPDYFHDIPGYAHRLHLDTPNVMPVGSVSWSAACATNFPRYMRSWDSVNPSYFIWRPSHSDVLEVPAIHHPVVYNRIASSWHMYPPSEQDLKDPLNDQKAHPLLFNLFYSHGVSVDFEVMTEDDKSYGFEQLADLLVRMGFAILKRDEDL